jgi:hypothetical protein
LKNKIIGTKIATKELNLVTISNKEKLKVKVYCKVALVLLNKFFKTIPVIVSIKEKILFLCFLFK